MSYQADVSGKGGGGGRRSTGDGSVTECETSFVISTVTIQPPPQLPTIVLPERPAFNQEAFDVNYQLITPPKKNVKERINAFTSTRCCSKEFWWNFAQARFPILSWIQRYKWKDYFLCDVIAGLTVSVLHISLGMAFSILSQLPPEAGLYVSFFSNLLYTFIGGSHHLAFCGTAVISVMVGDTVLKVLTQSDLIVPLDSNTNDLPVNNTLWHNPGVLHNSDMFHIDYGMAIAVASTITFVVGIIQLITGCLRLGGLSVYLSDTMLSGFLMGACIHVFSSQLTTVLGIKIPTVHSPLKVFKTMAHVAVRVTSANVATVITSFVTFLILVVVKWFSKNSVSVPFPIPVELFVVLVGTLVSYYMNFESVYNVDVLGYIPTGLPSPVVPSMRIIPLVFLDSFSISIITYAITISLGIVFAKKYSYKVDSNQELLALGVMNILGGFFPCVPTCVGMSRSLAQEAAGGFSLLTNFVASMILLLAILFIGPVFRCLPSCVLATIVFVVLRGMFSQLRNLHRAWTISAMEASLWLVAFLAVITFDIGSGLGIGFLYSLVMTVVRTQWPYTCELGRISGTDIYLDASKYQAAEVYEGVKIFHFASFLYFVNKEYFKSELYRLTGVDPTLQLPVNIYEQQILFTPSKNESGKLVSKDSPTYGSLEESKQIFVKKDKPDIQNIPPVVRRSLLHHIIIDASAWSYIDLPGIEALMQIVADYNERGIAVFIAACQATVSEKLENSEFYRRGHKHLVFPSIHDAMAYVQLDTQMATS